MQLREKARQEIRTENWAICTELAVAWNWALGTLEPHLWDPSRIKPANAPIIWIKMTPKNDIWNDTWNEMSYQRELKKFEGKTDFTIIPCKAIAGWGGKPRMVGKIEIKEEWPHDLRPLPSGSTSSIGLQLSPEVHRLYTVTHITSTFSTTVTTTSKYCLSSKTVRKKNIPVL